MDDQTEEWRVVEGWPDYQVSNLGRVLSKRPWGIGYRPPRILKPWILAGLYPAVTLYGESGEKKVCVHVLVCTAFHGPRPSDKHEVAHGDGNPANCRWDNLRWATSKENNADKKRHGTHRVGEENHAARLSEEDVLAIREAAASGARDVEIAEKFGTTHSNVRSIRIQQSWKHVKDGNGVIQGQRGMRGAAHYRAKLTETQVLQIREDPRRHDLIAADFAISKVSVSQIKCRRVWKHI